MALLRELLAPGPLLCGLLMAAIQSAFYFAAKLLIRNRTMYSLPGPIDAKIPFVPAAAVPYLSSYVFWVFSYMLLSVLDRPRYSIMLAAETLGCIICFVIYVAFPTRIEQPTPPGGFLGGCLRLLQWLDSPPVNLFPSMHCMASWICVFCAVGAVPPIWLAMSIVWTLLICWSTVTVKQHYFADTVAGLAVAVIVVAICLLWPGPAALVTRMLAALGL